MARPAIYDICMHMVIVEEVHNLLFSGICGEQFDEYTDVPMTLFEDGVLHFYYNQPQVWLSNTFSENV